MGMTAFLIRVTAAELDAYRQQPDLLRQRYFGVAGSLQGDNVYDLDKSWDGIIFLLTGKNSSDLSEPLSRIFFSNQLIDKNQDLGTGPAHFLTPAQVKALHDQVSTVVPASLKERFNAALMKEVGVYPNNVWDEPEVDDYLIEYFETVQEAFTVAAQNKEAMLSVLQ